MVHTKHHKAFFPAAQNNTFYTYFNEYIRRVDESLDSQDVKHSEEERTLVVMGGTAVFLWMGDDIDVNRSPTRDLDVAGTLTLMSNELITSTLKHAVKDSSVFQEIQFVGNKFFTPPDEVDNRCDVTEFFDIEYMRLKLPHPFDLMLSKFSRYFDKDYEDIKMLYGKYVLEPGKNSEFLNYYYTSYPFLTTDYEKRVFRDALYDVVGLEFDEELINVDPSNI